MEAAATFLLFQPGDETMQKNKGFYLQKGYAEKDFQPREVSVFVYLVVIWVPGRSPCHKHTAASSRG